jgi:hypothetical protein
LFTVHHGIVKVIVKCILLVRVIKLCR